MTATGVVGLIGWVLTLAAGISALALRVLRPDPILPNTFGMGDAGIVSFTLLSIVWGTVGAFLMARRPGNVVGRWVLLVGLGNAVSLLAAAAASSAAAQGAAGIESARVFGWFTGLGTLSSGGLFYLAFIFPTGRGPTRRWDLIGRLLLVVLIGTNVSLLLMPGPLHLFSTLENPFGVGFDLRRLFGPQLTPMVALGAFAFFPFLAAAMVSRYRASGPVERLQLRWFFSSVAIATAALGSVALGGVAGAASMGHLPLVAFGLAGTTVPISIGIAILRHHLYDLDRLISRTIGWALVSGALVGVFAFGVVGLQAALAGITQGQTFAVAGSTLLAFALFQPLRRRVQAAVDRRFDRAGFDRDRTAAVYAARVRDVVAIDALAADLAQTVSGSLRPDRLTVWLRGTGR